MSKTNIETKTTTNQIMTKHMKPETKIKKIPNSLIIFIKTRIPNFYKINYEPYMSVPKNKSHTVYFDPLIKYYEGPIKKIPPGAPKDRILTQFFEAPEFDSMINKILSDFRYMQKPRTFEQAYDQDIIENNLEITLNNLFKKNELLYLNKKPYTIVGVKYNKFDWQIDKKPLEKLLNQFSHLNLKQLNDEANKEENDIPENLRQRNLSSSNIAENEKTDIIVSNLTNASKKSDIQNDKKLEKEISGITDSFIPQSKLPGVSDDILELYTKYLRENIPINYSDETDLARDPLTLSLLIDPSDLLNYINKNKKSELIDLYSAFTNSKIMLNDADKLYKELCVELGQYKTNFDSEIIKINIKRDIENANEIILKITQLKVGYMQIIFKLGDTINDIYEKQNVYAVSTKALLEGLKKDYINIIKYYETPVLALKCIEYDIVNLNALIDEDPNNPYSVSYYKNYKYFKEFYKNQLYKNKQLFLEPVINLADETKIYMENLNVLQIEKEQYELYNFKIFLSYSHNQFDIWVLLFKSIELFIKTISAGINSLILLSDETSQKLNNEYTLEEQNNFLKEMEIKGVRATYNKSLKEFKWFLVKDDGTSPVDKTDEKYKLFEELYIDYIKTSVKTYDAIILYIYLLEILCLRQNRVYIAEENVNQLNLEYSITLDKYYEIIIKTINKKPNKKIYISPSLLWDVSNLDSLDFVQNKKKINYKQHVIYRARINSIAESRKSLIGSCDKILKIITPNISQSGFIEQCSNIIGEISSIMPHTFKSSYWLDKTIKNYDIHMTNDFIYNMKKVVKDSWYDKIIDDYDEKDFLDWIVFDNNELNIDSLYASVADGLNRQLEITNNETTNPYTTEIDGKRTFTIDKLKELVNDFNNERQMQVDLSNDGRSVLMFLEKTLKIKLIIFGMFDYDNSIQPGNVVLYNKIPYKIIKMTRENGNELYDLYNGYEEIKNVLKENIKDNPDDLFKHFRIYCDDDELDMEFTDYMYILVTSHKDENEQDIFKYQLVQSINKPYIFTADEIPLYIKYFIFNSCQTSDEQQLYAMGFSNTKLRDDILDFPNKRRQRIQKIDINSEIASNEKTIKDYQTKYKQLKKNNSKTLEQQFEQVRLREDIKDLKRIAANLKDTKKMMRKMKVNKLGGAINPSEQYSSFAPQYNPLGYPLNQNYPSNAVYLPRQSYPYPYQKSYYPNQPNVPYNVPHNVSQNKAKDQKSKLSFYITVELELFPGKSVNALQKSVVKCQSTFERIREAWANIFGFEYRPLPMIEAYDYKGNSNKTQKKTVTAKNTTRKIHSDK